MDFYEILDRVIERLRGRGRLTYRALKVQYQLGDEALEALKDELLFSHPVVDEEGRGVVWIGDASSTLSTAEGSARLMALGREPLAYTPSYLTEKILTSRSALEGERKQVTVLFADIKDSTELIRDLDPEAAQNLLDPALHVMMEAVHRFEGTVNQVLGDGIMALFGAPLAHEDHAVRACYAALAMQAAMQPHAEAVLRAHGIAMRIRVGMNAGEVVMRTIGNDLHMDYSAVGATTHLAARMEQIAAPGSIVISGAVLRLAEDVARVNALGAAPVKGMAAPVEVYELIGANAVRRRLQSAAARGLTRFVGRTMEIEALEQALERAAAGHGQLVAVVGEAGVGKSRLIYELIHSRRAQGWRVLESASVSYGKGTPYFPVIDLLKRYAGIEDGDDARAIRAKATGHILTLDETLQETIPAVLALLDALPDDSPFWRLDPPERRQRTLAGLNRLLLRESQAQPLLLVFEDLHWIDAETQALLDRLVESPPTAQLLLLVNYRPEYQHAWGNKAFYTQLRLDPLPPASADAFLASLLGNDASLDRLKALLIARTEGNPFFLEESVRTLVETQALLGEPGAYRLMQDLPTIQVPATVQAILAARIDRLMADEKRLLQTAAVIGMEVSQPLLQAIAEMPAAVQRRGLAHLQAAAFLYETNLYPEHVYTFKHALTHEVAYTSLLHEQRRVLHARIVEALEGLGGERLAEQSERLAHHAFRGELWDKAVPYCRQAGHKALARPAYHEAVSCFEQALEALQRLPAQRDQSEQAIDLRLDLVNALTPLGAYEQILDHLRTAKSVAETLHDSHRLGWTESSLSVYLTWVGAYDQAVEAGRRAIALATSHDNFAVHVRTVVHLGRIHYRLGDYHQALEVWRQALALLEGQQIEMPVGLTLPSVARTLSAGCYAELGAFAEGKRVGAEGLRIAETLNRPRDLVVAYLWLGRLALCQGDIQEAVAKLERGVAICQAMRILFEFPYIASELTVAYALVGRTGEALSLIEQVVEQVASGRRFAFLFGHAATGLSEASLRLGRLEDARAFATRALALACERQQRGVEAHARRLLGDIAMQLKPPEVDSAKTHYQDALALAKALGMRPLQAHCHRGLGVLYRQAGQAEPARAEWSQAIELYRDMDMTFWLPETETALAEVEGR